VKIISISNIVELNGLLKDKNFALKIHLRDACGRQSLWIEALDGQTVSDEGYEFLEKYFQKEGFMLTFSEDKINFWVSN